VDRTWSRETEVTSTNLEDDRNNNLIADKSEVEVNNDEDEMVSSGPDSPHSPPQRRPSSPSLVYRKAPPPELVAPGVPLDYSVSSVATAAQSAETAQENVYESVAKVRYNDST
jgi:hypothetical protein